MNRPAVEPAEASGNLSRFSVGRLSLYLFIYGAALSVVALFADQILPFPDVTNMGSKFRYFAAHRDRFDVLFVGSSQFFHQVIPSQFEREVATASGLSVRSFNFGVPGMWPPESFHLLREVLALHPAQLRWVVIELMDIDTRTSDAGGATSRMVLWHDWRHTAMVLARVAEQSGSWREKCEISGGHLALSARRLVNHGRGSEWIVGKLRKNNFGQIKNHDWVKERGYFPGEARSLEGAALTEYALQLERLKKAGPPIPMEPALAQAVAEMAAAVRASGAAPIFVSCPSVDGHPRTTEPGHGLETWLLNDPALFPELFDPAVRYDAIHLTPSGGVLFTHLLADRFVQWLHSHP